MDELRGGREGKIFRDGCLVYRPHKPWSDEVQKYLSFLHSKDVTCVPYPHGLSSEGHEIVSYIEGEVSNYPLTAQFSCDEALVSAAKTLRKIHDASSDYKALTESHRWMFQEQSPIEVMCHGDFAPYNVVMKNQDVVGVIDFDTIHPGPRVWDIAYAVYRWAPLKRPSNPDSFGTIETQAKRVKLFCESYGMDMFNTGELFDTAICTLESLIDYMRSQALAGNEDFAKNVSDGHDIAYLKDIDYIRSNEQYLKEILNA